ncbi:DUF2752 domain-containing protein [Xylanibacter muris]|uniref:DUF2752 domain-containing protein n=2 Tax=Xylanibacter muris TaxID=2736290 RepID=UPI003D811D69
MKGGCCKNTIRICGKENIPYLCIMMSKGHKIILQRWNYFTLSLCLVGDIWLFVNTVFDGHTGIVVCPSKLLYDISCPGCGVTRACVRILHGDFSGGILMNPNSLVILFGMLDLHVFMLVDFICEKDYLYKCIVRLDRLFQNRIILVSFFIFELIIAVRNNILGI